MSRERNRLFGTDGIRAAAGEFPLDRDSLLILGSVLGQRFKGARILIGRDTRQSGQEIAQSLTTGISGNASVFTCGVIPTPGLAYLVEYGGFDCGIMITASHNPYTDNGIKLFDKSGEKISQALEQEIEESFFAAAGTAAPIPDRPACHLEEQESKIYKDFLIGQAQDTGPGRMQLVLDCANGAAFRIAPEVFKEAGFDVETIHDRPDGQNINRDCGSTNLRSLKQTVRTRRADLGIAFDGDGDRAVFVDPKGHTLDGDHALYAISRYLLDTAPGFNKVVVGTVMGNLGLEKQLAQMGIKYLRAPVGDRHVVQEMAKHDAVIGGEQSGHIILRRLARTGDGILTASHFLKSLCHLDLRPEDIFNQLPLYPQAISSIDVRERRDLDTWPEFNEMLDAFNQRYGHDSRLLIRYSGTEPKVRIMLESEHESVIRENLGKFARFFESTIGASPDSTSEIEQGEPFLRVEPVGLSTVAEREDKGSPKPERGEPFLRVEPVGPSSVVEREDKGSPKDIRSAT